MFKKDFMWGAATASYQIEGAAYEDGKGLSIWDMFSRKPGAIFEGHTGDVACDHYHRVGEDVAIIKKLGLNAYRFSLSWPRILPDGIGAVNPKGIAFYNRLIDELLSNGITPFITLYHWDLPLALHHRGGWLNSEAPDWFANYAKVVAERFSNRAKHFITFNEPQCFIGLGYTEGRHAPGLHLSPSEAIPMAHNVLVAHGKAVAAMRRYGAADIQIGYSPCGTYPYPASESPEDVEAARALTFKIPEEPGRWFWNIAWWSDPVFLGAYPQDGMELYGQYLPANWRDDMALISQPLDFCGQNMYNGHAVKAGANGQPAEVKRIEGFPRGANQWPVTPESLKWGVKFLYERYKKPIYVTENGISCHDAISLDGQVHDPNRIDFLHRYLLALREAAAEGADVAGYFVWSLMDNFEWPEGYKERFGLVYIDYPTQRRIIKDSGRWYRSVIADNGRSL